MSRQWASTMLCCERDHSWMTEIGSLHLCGQTQKLKTERVIKLLDSDKERTSHNKLIIAYRVKPTATRGWRHWRSYVYEPLLDQSVVHLFLVSELWWGEELVSVGQKSTEGIHTSKEGKTIETRDRNLV